MAKLGISTGTTPNDGLGDNLLGGAVKINSNFSEIYTRFGDGNNLTAIGGTWVTTAAGIHTLKNVGIGTTNPRFKLEVGAVGSSGTTLFVNGDARVTGILTIGTASITIDGNNTTIGIGSGISLNGSTGSVVGTSIVLGTNIITGEVSIPVQLNTDDIGKNWTKIEMGAGIDTIYSLAYCGNGIVLAGAGFSSGDGDIYRSTDYGVNWIKIEMGAGLELISSLLHCGNGIVLAGSGTGSGDGDIYRSTDYGINWTKIEMGAELSGIETFVYCNDGIVIAGGGFDPNLGDIYRSTDYGVNWTKIEMGAGLDLIDSLVYCGNGIVLAGSGDGSNLGDIYRSTDYGVNWTKIEMGAEIYTIGELQYCGNGIVLAGSIGQNSGDGDIYRSTDYGVTFTKIEMGVTLDSITSLQYCGNGIVIAGSGSEAGEGDIYRSTDYGVTFTKIEMGVELLVIGSLTYCDNGIVIAGSGYGSNLGDIYRSDIGISQASSIQGIFQQNITGNIGIGTTNPTSALTVKGNTSLETLNVSGISTLGTVQISSGIVTATSGIVTYYGDTSNAADGRWTLGASGNNDYTFTGIGFTQTTSDPVLYLARGRVYEFVNNSGGSHPFQIRVSNGGSAYSNGVTNNAAASGVIRFEVPFNAPNTLYYQCTNHSGMGATIFVTPRNEPAVGVRTTVTATTSSIGAGATSNLNIDGFKTYSLLKVGISSAAWVVLYTDSTSRSNDASRSYLTDPTPGSGVIAEVRTVSSGISTFIMSPGVIGWNNDVSVASTIYARVTNNESSTSAGIGVTLTVVKLED